MANRFWVGASNSWNATAGTKWALTSGGAGGQAVPTSSDDVFFDGSSGSGTVTVTTDLQCKTLNFTGFTGTFVDNASGPWSLSLLGTTLTLGSGMTNNYGTGSASSFILASSSGGTITSNGKTFQSVITISTDSSTWGLGDNFVSTKRLTNIAASVTFNSNNHNITASGFSSDNGMTALNMGSGTWTMTGNSSDGNATWKCASGVNAGTSTLIFNDATSNAKTIGLAGTFNAVQLTGGGSGTFSITASPTISTLTVNPPLTVSMTAGVTITATTPTISGTAGNLNTFTSGGTWTISVASGTLSLDYLSLTNSHATGGATFSAGTHSTDGGGNTGWIFGAPGAGMLMAFF